MIFNSIKSCFLEDLIKKTPQKVNKISNENFFDKLKWKKGKVFLRSDSKKEKGQIFLTGRQWAKIINEFETFFRIF